MPVSIIVGGQYGSEGKGKVASYFAKKYKASAVVRVGGPNSGHTIVDKNREPLIFKHLPTSCIAKGVKSVLTSGHYINLDILLKEIEVAGLNSSDLIIDPFTAIITQEDIESEKEQGLIENIGSTASGLGAAILNRVSRNRKSVFAKDIQSLTNFIGDANKYLRDMLNQGERIIIEGTQGFGLSLLHSNLYPFATSRDTTASGFLSEAGLSPFDVDDIIMVIRTFPIRVAGNSGPLINEITWKDLSNESGSKESLVEFTSVSKKVRRVARFDPEIVKKAIMYNRPTKIVLNHLDYIDKTNSNTTQITRKMIEFINRVEKSINAKIDYVGIDRESLIENNFESRGVYISSITNYASA